MHDDKGKINLDSVMTAGIGSYPKPDYLYPGSGRQILDSVGLSFYQVANEIGEAEFQKRLDQAVLTAIQEQDRAGIEIVTDGEERRGHYVTHILRKLDGIDFENWRPKSIREGKYIRELPVVVGEVRYREPILVDEYIFTQKHARGIPKIGLPGPMTVVDTVLNEYYESDDERFAFDYAEAIRHEVKNLIEAGCRVIQFDDPVLIRYPEKAQAWGFRALEACIAGHENAATYFVHVCRGYPDEKLDNAGVAYKADANNYADLLRWLSASTFDGASIEAATVTVKDGEKVHDELDLAVLPAVGNKTVLLGVVDVGSHEVETIDYLEARMREALQYLPKEQLIFAPNCGLVELTPETARAKLANIVEAAAKIQ
ncbi:MAG: hypothetical protein D6737_15865 [Chloroflexi bacterium]|nr:MAG: hypothetical protein D6737_15865 [Chloroflexota bacterium]